MLVVKNPGAQSANVHNIQINTPLSKAKVYFSTSTEIRFPHSFPHSYTSAPLEWYHRKQKERVCFPLSPALQFCTKQRQLAGVIPTRLVTLESEEEADEIWALIASCFLEQGMGVL